MKLLKNYHNSELRVKPKLRFNVNHNRKNGFSTLDKAEAAVQPPVLLTPGPMQPWVATNTTLPDDTATETEGVGECRGMVKES